MFVSFGQELRQARKKLGLTVEEIARASGVSRSYVTLMENDKRLPGKKTLPKIAGALNAKTTVVLNWYLEDLRKKLL